MELLGIVVWYATGFVGATVLIRHGHSRTVVWFSAALVGGLMVVPAVVVLLRRSHAVQHHGRAEPRDQHVSDTPCFSTDGADTVAEVDVVAAEVLVALLDVDDDGAVADAAVRLRRPGELVIVVGRVGHEASTAWLDTGELERVHEQLDFARRRIEEPRRTLVCSGTLADLVDDAVDRRRPRVLLAPADGAGRRRQVELRRIAATLGCPLLLVPSHSRAVSA